jgi:hypothetical protein
MLLLLGRAAAKNILNNPKFFGNALEKSKKSLKFSKNLIS